MDRLEAMTMLAATADTGSFSAASRKLGVPLPTLSRKIAELEKHLNARLFVRSTRKLALTEAGANYLQACTRILELVSEAETEVSGEFSTPRGELTIAAPIVLGRLHVVPVVNDFLAHFPEINARMILSDRNVNLLEDHIDMAVRVGTLPDSRMVATRVGTIRRVVCGSPDYFAGHGIPKTPKDLPDFTCVTFAGMPGAWTFEGRKFTGQPERPRCRLNINTAEAAIDAAIAGVGLTQVLSYQVSRAIAEGKLRVVLKEFEPEPFPVHIVHPGQGLLPLKVRRFLEFAVPRLRKALAEGHKHSLA
jgi:DNA-binding transcriptional LysR family regulator